MGDLVIVTGGSSGLGRALLDAAPVGSTRIDVSRTGHGGDGVRHVPADLGDPTAWAEVGDKIHETVTSRTWGRVTFVHSAGTLHPIGFVGETDADEATGNVLLNSASGQVLGHRFLAAVLPLRSRRELVFISSGAANKSVPGWATYGASKAAYDQWVRTVGEEQRRRGGVKVLSIAPGVIATPMQEHVRATDERDLPGVQRFRDLHAAGRLADPDLTAHALWNLLDEPDVVSGSVLDLRDR